MSNAYRAALAASDRFPPLHFSPPSRTAQSKPSNDKVERKQSPAAYSFEHGKPMSASGYQEPSIGGAAEDCNKPNLTNAVHYTRVCSNCHAKTGQNRYMLCQCSVTGDHLGVLVQRSRSKQPQTESCFVQCLARNLLCSYGRSRLNLSECIGNKELTETRKKSK